MLTGDFAQERFTRILDQIFRSCREDEWNKVWYYLLMYWKFPMMLINLSVKSDWLFNTQSRVLQSDWLIIENNEKATLNINMP